MDLDAVADAIIRAHSKRMRGRTYRPGLLRKLASPPRRSEGAIDYSISGNLDHQYTAPGSFAGDFGGGGGGTQHATRLYAPPGWSDDQSGEYARSSVDDVGRWENDQPFAGLSQKAHGRIKRAAQLAIKKQGRSAVKVPATRPERAGRPDPYGYIVPGAPKPAEVEFLPVQPGRGYGIVYDKTRYGGRASGRAKADIRWASRPDRKVPVVNESEVSFDPISDILKEASDRGY